MSDESNKKNDRSDEQDEPESIHSEDQVRETMAIRGDMAEALMAHMRIRGISRPVGDAGEYALLPPKAEHSADYFKSWRIELHWADQGQIAGFDVLDDVKIGRRAGTKNPPDLCLDDYHPAAALSVSREHAMLRPTQTRLYLLDLKSTNGTAVNGMPMSVGSVQILKDKDLLTFGNVTCQLRIIDTPPAAT